jgi:hypothetical protein
VDIDDADRAAADHRARGIHPRGRARGDLAVRAPRSHGVVIAMPPFGVEAAHVEQARITLDPRAVIVETVVLGITIKR